MSSMRVNPNRMELIRLGRRLSLARRGHRLLKDKQDELMDRFTDSVREVRRIRTELEEGYAALREAYISSFSSSSAQALDSYGAHPPVELSISVEYERLMNLKIPAVKAEFRDNSARLGAANLSPALPEFIRKFAMTADLAVSLTNSERKMYMVAEELQKVRRRVNALEHIFIPRLQETLGYIAMQLEEMERENITRLMKVKDIVRKNK